jgi:cytochrome P450
MISIFSSQYMSAFLYYITNMLCCILLTLFIIVLLRNIKILCCKQKNIPDEKHDGFTIKHHPRTIIIESQRISKIIFSQDMCMKQENLDLGDLFGRFLGKCMGNLNSQDRKWGQVKKIFKPIFKNENYIYICDDIIQEWDTELKKLFSSDKIHKEGISIDEIICDLPLKFIMNVIFGKSFVEKNNELINELKQNAGEIIFNILHNEKARSYYYRYMNTSLNKTVNNFNKKWNGMLRNALNNNTGIYDVLHSNFIDSGLEWDYFSQTLSEIVYANQDVVAPSFCWLMAHYSRYHTVLNQNNIDNFIEESARLAPVSKYLLPKLTTKPIDIDGYVLKKDTIILVDNYAVGKSKDWNMNDLDTFNPDRFDNIDISYFTTRFGFGSRQCVGNKIAKKLFNDALTYMYENWTLIPLEPYQEIKLDKSKAFLSPECKVWLARKQDNIETIPYYIDTSPYEEHMNNSFMAVSVNEKSPFLSNEDNIDKVVRYLCHISHKTQLSSVVLICDDIARHNYMAFDKRSPDRALTEARKLGKILFDKFDKSIKSYDKSNLVKLCRWKDINENEEVDYIKQNALVEERVNKIANNFIRMRSASDKTSSTKLTHVMNYIYSEIQVLINGIYFEGTQYRMMYYAGNHKHLVVFTQNSESLMNLIRDIYNHADYNDILNEIIKRSHTQLPKIKGSIVIEI